MEIPDLALKVVDLSREGVAVVEQVSVCDAASRTRFGRCFRSSVGDGNEERQHR